MSHDSACPPTDCCLKLDPAWVPFDSWSLVVSVSALTLNWSPIAHRHTFTGLLILLWDVSDTVYGKHTVLLGILETSQSLLGLALQHSLSACLCLSLTSLQFCPDEMEIKNVQQYSMQHSSCQPMDHRMDSPPPSLHNRNRPTAAAAAEKDNWRHLLDFPPSQCPAPCKVIPHVSVASDLLLYYFLAMAWSQTVFPGRLFI